MSGEYGSGKEHSSTFPVKSAILDSSVTHGPLCAVGLSLCEVSLAVARARKVPHEGNRAVQWSSEMLTCPH